MTISFLFFGSPLSVGVGVAIVGLVPEVPGEDAGIVGECADDALDVALEARILRWIGEDFSARSLHPAGVVDAGNGRMLRAELGVRVPAGVEEDKDGADVMACGDGQKSVDALREAFRVLLPEQVVQEDAHGVHADGFGPAEFAIDGGGVEGVGLPHFQLVDGGGGKEVGAHRPGLLGVPGVGLGFGPASFLVQ